MSRTYRRTNRKTPDWVTIEWYTTNYNRRNIRNHFPTRATGKEAKRRINNYHSDHYGSINAPSDFVNLCCNRPFRAKMNQETRRILKQGDYEEYEFIPFRKDANWQYW